MCKHIYAYDVHVSEGKDIWYINLNKDIAIDYMIKLY